MSTGKKTGVTRTSPPIVPIDAGPPCALCHRGPAVTAGADRQGKMAPKRVLGNDFLEDRLGGKNRSWGADRQPLQWSREERVRLRLNCNTEEPSASWRGQINHTAPTTREDKGQPAQRPRYVLPSAQLDVLKNTLH